MSNRQTHLQHLARREHDRFKRAEAESIDAYLACGAALVEAKDAAAHGEWLPWLRGAGIPERTAQRMMKLARAGMESDTVSDLGGIAAALDSLATPAETFRLPDNLRRIADIKYRKDLDPRMYRDPETVRAYVHALTQPLFPGDGDFPPIEINQRDELIDGWFRIAAFKAVGRTEIEVTVTEVAHDDEHILLAAERNSGGGLVMTAEDRRHARNKLDDRPGAHPDSEGKT